VPSIPADAVKICEVFRRTIGATPSGNVIQSGDIVDKRKSTGLHGTPRVLLPGDALADAGGYHGERRMRAGDLFVPTGIQSQGIKVLYDYWDAANNTWRGTQTIKWTRPTITPASFLPNPGTQTMASVTIPDPGWPYYVEAGASALAQIPSPGFESDAITNVWLQTTLDEDNFSPTPASRIILRSLRPFTVASPYQILCPMTGYRSVLTGSHTVYMHLRNESSPARFISAADNEYIGFDVHVIPA
jgi:hypothetical protein